MWLLMDKLSVDELSVIVNGGVDKVWLLVDELSVIVGGGIDK